MKPSRLGKAVSLSLFLALFFFGLSVAAVGAKEKGADSEALAKGKAVYEAQCALCHGEKGDGKGPAGAAVKAANFTQGFKRAKTDEEAKHIILNGIPGTAMVGFAGRINEEEAESLVHYIKGFLKK